MAEEKLSAGEKEKLLQVARRSLESYLKEGRWPEFGEFSGYLAEPRGAFVTLKNKGELRGCIGLIESDRPLYETVAKMAVAAATEDNRFHPVSAEELSEISIEISALTPLRKIKDASEIQLGKHGVVIKEGTRGGVFLPQVAEETGWDLEQFMSNLCAHKAGLSPDAWKTGEADIYVFEAEVFGEKDK